MAINIVKQILKPIMMRRTKKMLDESNDDFLNLKDLKEY